MEKVFDGSMNFFKARTKRQFSPTIEFGDDWQSSTLKLSQIKCAFIEDTGEFYLLDRTTLKIYLMDTEASCNYAAEQFMDDWRQKMTQKVKIEHYFPELSQIATEVGPVDKA